MTGGLAAILGPTGKNFAAGMTGGMAFVLDVDGGFERRVNPESVVLTRLASAHWEGVLKRLVERHLAETGSPLAEGLLHDWELVRGRFWQVCPKEMVSRLSHPLDDAVATEAVG